VLEYGGGSDSRDTALRSVATVARARSPARRRPDADAANLEQIDVGRAGSDRPATPQSRSAAFEVRSARRSCPAPAVRRIESPHRSPQPAANISTKLSSAITSRRISGKAARNPGTMPGNTRRAAMIGTFSRSVPVGRSRKRLTTSREASTSTSAGPNRSNNRAPASVGTTLRVVRFRSRTPSLVSSLRTAH
jgi:hypothetical protein